MFDAMKFRLAKLAVDIAAGVCFIVLIVVGLYVRAWFEARREQREWEAERAKREADYAAERARHV